MLIGILIIVTLYIITMSIIDYYNYRYYRLGDAIKGYGGYNRFRKYNIKYPGSIAGLYIEELKKQKDWPNKKSIDYNILKNICDLKIEELNIPKYNVSIHLRLGDVLLGKTNNKYIWLRGDGYYGYPIEKYENMIKKELTNIKKVHLFFGSPNNANSSLSYQYINELKDLFNKYGIELIDAFTNNADIDFLTMVNSDIYITSGSRDNGLYGGFNHIITNLSKINKHITIDPINY